MQEKRVFVYLSSPIKFKTPKRTNERTNEQKYKIDEIEEKEKRRRGKKKEQKERSRKIDKLIQKAEE